MSREGGRRNQKKEKKRKEKKKRKQKNNRPYMDMTLACAAGVGGVEGGRTTKPKMKEKKKIRIGHIWI